MKAVGAIIVAAQSFTVRSFRVRCPYLQPATIEHTTRGGCWQQPLGGREGTHSLRATASCWKALRGGFRVNNSGFRVAMVVAGEATVIGTKISK